MSGFARRLQQAMGVLQTISGTILAKDDFDRADGSLGFSESGSGYSAQAWSMFGTPISGSMPTWSITNKQVQVSAPGGTNSEALATIPIAVLSGTVFADIYLSPNSACAALCLRASSDGRAYLNVQLNESDTYDRIALSKRINGVTTWLATVTPANIGNNFGYTLATVLTPSGITVYVDGAPQFNYTFTTQDLTDLSGASYVGLRAWYDPTDEDGGSRWDRFLVTDSTSAPVARVPAAPWNLTAVNAGSGVADISWSRGGNGGSPLTGYIITSTDGYSHTLSDPEATSFQATGLNNVAQTFTVTAVNAIGNGAGAVSASVTPGAASVPGAPTNVVATPGDTSVPVTWTAPANDGGAPITSYTVTSNPGNKTVNSSTTSAVVMGLTNGTAYTFTVTATNSAGTGAASSPSNSVTPTAAGSFNYLANPSAYGYPDVTNTGSVNKSTLTQVSGTITLTAGQTLSNTYVVGRVVLSGSSGTAPAITNCYIENGGTSPALDCSGWSGTNQPQVTDTTIITTNTEAPLCITGPKTASTATNFLRVNASGAQDIIHNGYTTWQDSYIHDCLRNAAGTSHADLCQLTAGSVTMTHCTAHPNNGSDFQNSVLEIGEQSGTVGDILFSNCLLGGGNYTFNANWNSTSPNVDTNWPVGSAFRGPNAFSSLTVQNCRFARVGGAYFPPQYGTKTHVSSPPSGTYTWTGNVYDDDGSAA